MVQRDDTALAWRKSEFDSRWVHRLRKVAGYGSPGRFAKPCGFTAMWVQIPRLPLFGSMVKRKSCLGSNEEFWVQILVELLIDMVSVV